MTLIIDDPDDPALGEIIDTVLELAARGLVSVEENDLGELHVSPTQAGLDALRDDDAEDSRGVE